MEFKAFYAPEGFRSPAIGTKSLMISLAWYGDIAGELKDVPEDQKSSTKGNDAHLQLILCARTLSKFSCTLEQSLWHRQI